MKQIFLIILLFTCFYSFGQELTLGSRIDTNMWERNENDNNIFSLKRGVKYNYLGYECKNVFIEVDRNGLITEINYSFVSPMFGDLAEQANIIYDRLISQIERQGFSVSQRIGDSDTHFAIIFRKRNEDSFFIFWWKSDEFWDELDIFHSKLEETINFVFEEIEG